MSHTRRTFMQGVLATVALFYAPAILRLPDPVDVIPRVVTWTGLSSPDIMTDPRNWETNKPPASGDSVIFVKGDPDR